MVLFDGLGCTSFNWQICDSCEKGMGTRELHCAIIRWVSNGRFVCCGYVIATHSARIKCTNSHNHLDSSLEVVKFKLLLFFFSFQGRQQPLGFY